MRDVRVDKLFRLFLRMAAMANGFSLDFMCSIDA
jgi:hypothetical protein